MFYRRGDATHRPLISLLAYVGGALVYSVPFRFVLVYMNHPTGWW